MNKKILTNREKEVFDLLVQNNTTKEIAQKLNISEKTVKYVLKSNGIELRRYCKVKKIKKTTTKASKKVTKKVIPKSTKKNNKKIDLLKTLGFNEFTYGN